NQRLTKSLLLKRGLPCGYAPHTCTSPSPPEEAPTFRPGRNPAPGKGGPAKPGQPKAPSAQDLPSSLTDPAKAWNNANIRTGYKGRIYPTEQQAAVLNRTFGCVRLVWNKVHAWRHARYHAEGIKTSYAETDRYLTELKRDPEFAFLFEVSSVPLQQTLRHQY